MSEVVVTGRGVVTAYGDGVDALWEGLCSGTPALGACASFDPDAAMGAREARRADRFTQLAVAAAEQAARDASLGDVLRDGDEQRRPGGGAALGDKDVPGEQPRRPGCDAGRVGVVVGTGIGGILTLVDQVRAHEAGGDRAVSPHFVPMMMPNAAAGTIAMRLGLRGPGFSVASACATGAHALGEALRMLERGEADVVLAGGAEAALTDLCLTAFARMGALSPTGRSLPFDARRDGFVMGEGAAVLVLERAEHAAARGATPYARLAGYGASNDAFHITQPDAEGRGAVAAIRAALADAGAAAGDVGYVNAHGTGTPFNDRIEAAALRATLGNGRVSPPVSSTKGAVGHLLGAAGAVEALVCVEAVRRGVLPPTMGFEEPDPEVGELDVVAGAPRTGRVDLALSTSFGFGGQNACLAVAAA